MRILSADEFFSDTFAERWHALLQACPAHDLGQTYAWNRSWWQFYEHSGAGVKQLFVLVNETDGKLSAVWPLFIRRRHGLRVIHWLGQTEGMITDYMLPVLPLDKRAVAIRDFLEFLSEQSSLWDVLDLTMPMWSSLFPLFAKSAVLHGTRAGLAWESGITDHSAAIELPSSFNVYLSSLGPKTRAHLKQYLRAAEEAGAHFEAKQGALIASGLPDLFRLNAGRWNVFASDISRNFLRQMLGQVVADSGIPLLVCLRLHGKHLASALCYQQSGICFVHSAGVVRETISGFSPGTTLYALLIRSLIGSGGTRLDFSPGLEEYKLRLGATVEPMFRFTLWRRLASLRRWRVLNWVRSAKQALQNAAVYSVPEPPLPPD